MEAEILAITNQKGGVGKTSVSVNLSYGLAQQNHKVLLIDLDSQANSSKIFFDLSQENYSTISDVLENKNFDIQNSIYPAQVKGEIVENLYIIPSNIHLALTSEQIISKYHREELLHEQLKKISSNYDYIIIDSNPALNVLTVNALFPANKIIIPTNYDSNALDGIADLFNTINEVKRDQKFEFRILLNQRDKRNSITKIIEEELKKAELTEHTFETHIRITTNIGLATAAKEPVQVYAPKGTAQEDYERLIKELTNNA